MSDIFLLFFFRGNPPVQVGSEMVDEEILGGNTRYTNR